VRGYSERLSCKCVGPYSGEKFAEPSILSPLCGWLGELWLGMHVCGGKKGGGGVRFWTDRCMVSRMIH